ncbi:MAG: UDP-N-acetylmuramoyl-L-alanyl-D-glutamate--2,6-diaminopimelate ligase [Oscillospiraceae bacterium]|nr:UDP-N-acetylmuramoyl-L-alanyl-D-glutamate--2,6-diaminopimelate ligase [Oscillospiraceae bacterium]
MTIAELFSGIVPLDYIPDALKNAEVAGVTSDSREAESGFVFVCIKGASFDGHSAAEKLLEQGVCAVVTSRKLGLDREINVEDPRRIYPMLLSNFCGNPTRRIKLGAVTGTNGKTTVVNLCAQITRLMGHKTGVIGTLGTDTGSGLVYSHDGPPTTPEPRRLYELFKRMAEENTEFCFIEASSQALAQHRFAAEDLAAGAFTNLTRDHLDYHKTMENYFAAKRSLFDMCGYAVVNVDDEYGVQAADYCRGNNIPLKTVSVNGKADYYTEFVKLYADRSEFVLTDSAEKKSYPVRFAMTGNYNVLNAVTAAVMVHLMGFPMDEVLCALEKIRGVSGRLETLYSGEFTVIRDYAHTEDGLEKLLAALKPLAKNRLISVFGAAGERDAGKRPDMGKAAARYSDILIVTTDSPRHEDPQQTIDDVVKGIPEGVPHEEYTDRREAVLRALELAEEGDVVALCGKGHEDYQAIGDVYYHFDEKEIVEEYFSRK